MLSPAAFAQFNGQLALAVERDMPLPQALEIVAAQFGGRLRDASMDVARRHRDGVPLPDALRSHADLFPPDYVALVEAGLEGACLADLLRHAETYHSLRARVRRQTARLALTVAIGAVICAAVLAATALLAPQLRQMMVGIDMQMPTASILAAQNPGWFLAAAPCVLVLAAFLFQAFRGASRLTRAGYWIPVVGRVAKSRDIAAFCTAMAAKLRAGRPAWEAAEGAAAAVENRYAAHVLRRCAMKLREGIDISTVLFYERLFPRTLAWAVSLAEKRNEVPGAFHLFARIYSAELERSFEILMMVLAPLGVLAIGNFVLLCGYFLIAPILSLISILQGIGGGGGGGPSAIGAAVPLAFINVLFLFCGSVIYLTATRRRAKIALLVDHLAGLARAGLPLQSALRVIGQDLRSFTGLRLSNVARSLEEGAPLGEAMNAAPHVFPPVLRTMAALGERTGNLGGFLDEMARSYRRQESSPQHSLYYFVYPIFLTAVINLLMLLLYTFIVPKFQEVLDQVRISFPYLLWWDRIMFGSQALFALCLVTMLSLVLGGASPHFTYSPLRPLRAIADRLFLWIPAIGRLLRESALHRFATAMGLMLRAGAPLPEAAAVAAAEETNSVLRRRFETFARRLADGGHAGELARAVASDLAWFVETGQASGRLADHLLEAGAWYDGRVRYAAQLLSRAVIPIFVILNGALVLAVMAVTLLPLRELIQGVVPW
jgi:type II secretory pathway component PulF